MKVERSRKDASAYLSGTCLAIASVQGRGDAVDRRHIELQIRAVVVTYRIERERRDARTMQSFLARATALLDGIDAETRAYPDLAARLLEARQELADMASGSSADEEAPDTAGVEAR
jgi:hypothetical protein